MEGERIPGGEQRRRSSALPSTGKSQQIMNAAGKSTGRRMCRFLGELEVNSKMSNFGKEWSLGRGEVDRRKLILSIKSCAKLLGIPDKPKTKK